MKRPLALIGFMGSGKTVVGALVADRTGAPFHDQDLMVEFEARMTIAEIFANTGEAAFLALESRLLPAALEPAAVVALGGGAVEDSNWRLITERAMTVFLDVSFETIWQRVGGAEHRPLAAGRSRADLEALLLARRPRYEQAAHRVDGDQPADLVVAEVEKLWSA